MSITLGSAFLRFVLRHPWSLDRQNASGVPTTSATRESPRRATNLV